MLSALYFLATIAGTTIAASLSPGIRSYAYSISDFQGHMLDLTDGNPQVFTPVQSFTAANTTNQQWAIISSQDSRNLFEIVNVGTKSIISHTTALLKPPGPGIRAQIVGNNQTTWWRLANTPKGSRWYDADTGLVLTAWPAYNGNPSSPLTLEYPDVNNMRQLFNITCLFGYSIPGDC